MTADTAESLLREFARKRTNKGRAAACPERCYANAAQEDAADASADWQEVLGAALEEQDQTAAAAATCPVLALDDDTAIS